MAMTRTHRVTQAALCLRGDAGSGTEAPLGGDETHTHNTGLRGYAGAVALVPDTEARTRRHTHTYLGRHGELRLNFGSLKRLNSLKLCDGRGK